MWRIQTFSWGQFILFPSISRLFLYWRGKPKSIAKLGGGAWPDIPPWIRHCSSPAAPQVLSVKMFVTQGPIIHRTGIFVWDWFEQGLQVERNITSGSHRNKTTYSVASLWSTRTPFMLTSKLPFLVVLWVSSNGHLKGSYIKVFNE